jgi:hypothetical protein
MPGHKLKRQGLAKPGNGSWQQFQPGNEVNLAHGLRSPSRTAQVADVIVRELAEMPECPEWLRDPSFAHAIRGWGNAEARLLMYESWMDAQPDEMKYLATGAQEPLISRWTRLSELAARHRGRLGLDPVSRVRIGKALTSAGVDIAKLAAMEYGRDTGDAGLD